MYNIRKLVLLQNSSTLLNRLTEYLQCLAVEANGFLSKSLFTFDIGKIIERVGVGWTQSQRSVITLLSVLHVSLLFQSIRQVTVRIREVWL